MTEQDIDQELVKRTQTGDKHAFNMLVFKYQFKVAKLVGRYIKDKNEIFDVCQEVFIKTYRALPKFRGDSAFYTWLYRITVNTAKNYIVAQERRPPDLDIDVSDAEQWEGRSGLKEDSSPERMLLKDEIERTVFTAIEQLPEELRVAITLRELEGLSYEEIANVMACPVGTVRSRIFRAREAIDKLLKPLLENE